MNGFIRLPRLLFTEHRVKNVEILSVLIELLLTAAEYPYISTTGGVAVPVGRGEIRTSIQSLAERLHERPLHIKRALLDMASSGMISWYNRLPAEKTKFPITVLRYYRYSSFVCDVPATMRVYRSIMDKPWYVSGRVKAVYLFMLAQTHTRQVGGVHVGLQVAELAYATGISKRNVLNALRALADAGDIDYLATDRRCEVVFRAPPDERVIHVDFHRAGSETG